ncbi:MAG: TlpA disulfide reductase family protein [bacterium]
MMRRLWIFLLIAGIAIIAVSAFQYLTRPGRGDPAPAFALPSLDSKEIDIEGYRGRPVLLHFWASWCGLCQEEFPSLVRLAKDYEAQGLVVLAISEDEARSYPTVRAFTQTMNASFPILLDGKGAVADSYQSWAVPETIFIDSAGTISWRHSGPVNWDSDPARKMVSEFIQK